VKHLASCSCQRRAFCRLFNCSKVAVNHDLALDKVVGVISIIYRTVGSPDHLALKCILGAPFGRGFGSDEAFRTQPLWSSHSTVDNASGDQPHGANRKPAHFAPSLHAGKCLHRDAAISSTSQSRNLRLTLVTVMLRPDWL
jgi:hypothetical protein